MQGECIQDFGPFAKVALPFDPPARFNDEVRKLHFEYASYRKELWRDAIQGERDFYILDSMPLDEAEKIIRDFLERGLHPKSCNKRDLLRAHLD